MQHRPVNQGFKRKLSDSENKSPKEKKLKETKMTAAEEKAKGIEAQKYQFLLNIYREKPVYFDNLKKDKRGQLLKDEEDENRLTLQVRILIERIKAEHLKYLKEDALQMIEKEVKSLTEDQKVFINTPVQILEESGDPTHQLFAKHLKKIEIKKWDIIPNRYFSSFNIGSVLFYVGSVVELELRAKKRRIMFQQGKEFLETLLFRILDPEVNPRSVKKNLNELYFKIEACSPGFITDLQTALIGLSKNFESLFAEKKLEISQQAASNFAIKIIERRKGIPLTAPDSLKELTHDDAQFTHAVSELTNYLSLNNFFPIPKSLDIDANGFFSEKEKKEFKDEFLNPKKLYDSIIEAFFSHYWGMISDVNSLETLQYFSEQLNQLSNINEAISTYFEEDPIRLKTNVDVSKLLRESIIKRSLLSGCLGDLFTHRSIKKLEEEEKLCDVVLTTIPYQSKDKNQNKLIFDKLPKNGKPYTYLVQNRNFLCFALSDEKELSVFNFDQIPDSTWYAYAILKRKDKPSELYFLQKVPQKVRKVFLNTLNQKLFERTIKDIPTEIGSRVLSPLDIDIEKIKKLDPEERHEKIIYFVNKENPEAAYQVLNNLSGGEAFNDIINDLVTLRRQKNEEKVMSPFIFTGPESLAIIAKHTNHAPVDTLYLNHRHVLESMVVAPRLLLGGSESFLMLLDYFKIVGDYHHSIVLEELRSHKIPLEQLFINLAPFVSDEIIRKFIHKIEAQNLFITNLNAYHFFLVNRVNKAIPLTLPDKYRSQKWLRGALKALIDKNNAPEIRDFQYFCQQFRINLSLIFSPYPSETPMEYAARNGKINVLNMMLKILQENKLFTLVEGDRKSNFQSKLQEGLDLLINNHHYSLAREFFECASHYGFEFPLLSAKLLLKVADYCKNEEADNLDQLLSNFEIPKENLKLYFFQAANNTSKYIIDVFMKHGLDDEMEDENEEGFLEHIEKGILELLYGREYEKALDVMTHFSISLSTIDLSDVFLDMKEHLILNINNKSPLIQSDTIALIRILKLINQPQSLLEEGVLFPFPIIILASNVGNVEALWELMQIPFLITEGKNPIVVHSLQNSIDLEILKTEPKYEAIEWLIKKFPAICSQTTCFSNEGKEIESAHLPFAYNMTRLEKIKMLEMIIKYSPQSLNDLTKSGRTCLYDALTRNKNDISVMLIDASVDLSFQHEETKKSYLHIACEKNNYEMVRYLVQANAPFDLKDEGRATPYLLDISRNLKVFLLLQLLKKYIELNHRENRIKLLHLNYILQKERDSVDDAKTDWGRVFYHLRTITRSHSPISSTSMFKTSTADMQEYLSIINKTSFFEAYHELCGKIHSVRFKQNLDLESKPSLCISNSGA